eukprot:TRINITY_DN70624_c0_g1_i1.p1 TRINITY_DN70624_c0_g1~~TRINITY_DN70624_c0_g1_i1.p1  ORF type:complete len:391 (+),score=74.37 TRINITY_DN70624_c0_g1_i1:122-1294(+)
MTDSGNASPPAQGAELDPVEEELRDAFGPYRRDTKTYTMNELRDHPLFMEDMPRDISDNPHLLALQSILYDGNTPEEMAELFRKHGNDAFRNSTNEIASTNAIAYYSKGLEMECKDDKLNSQLYSNRAAVSLRLNEYVKAVEDCRAAVRLDPTNMKALFRGAKASEGLGLTSQALLFCAEALKISPKEKEILQTQARLRKTLAREEADREEKKRLAASKSEALSESLSSVRSVLESRNIKLGPCMYDMAMYRRPGVKIWPKLSEDDASVVQWPLMLVYEEYGTSDYVEIFDERVALEEQLQLMFPEDRHADWDTEGKYVWHKLVAYLETLREDGADSEGLFLPARIDVPLEEAFAKANVLPLCLVLRVFVGGSSAEQAFCKRNELPVTGK